MTRALIAIAVLWVATARAAGPDRDSQLIGTFISNDFDFSQSLVVRGADHTFTEYRFQVLDYAKPPAVALTLRGTWALKGRDYCQIVSECSYGAWHDLIGQTRCFRIVALTPAVLQYFSSDSAPIRERRVDARQAAALVRNPFSFVSQTVRQKYGFRRH
jgi:hypothetical protein